MLPPASKVTVFMRKNLKQAISDMKTEVQMASVFAHNRICPFPEEKSRGLQDEVFAFVLFSFYIKEVLIFKLLPLRGLLQLDQQRKIIFLWLLTQPLQIPYNF